METAGRAYVLSATIALVAMADRAGWIDWAAVSHVVEVGMGVTTFVIAVLLVAAAVVGLPVVVVVAVTEGVLRLFSKTRFEEPSA